MSVLAEEFEAAPRLAQLGMTTADLLDIVRVAVGARRNAVGFHPASAAGLFSGWRGPRSFGAYSCPRRVGN